MKKLTTTEKEKWSKRRKKIAMLNTESIIRGCRPRSTKKPLFLQNIDKNTKALFKAWCRKNKVSMTEMIEQFMRDKIKEQ